MADDIRLEVCLCHVIFMDAFCVSTWRYLVVEFPEAKRGENDT